MNALIAVTLLMLVQYFFFGALVARARATWKVSAPSMTGPECFERVARVHLNIQERLVMMLPLMATTAHFWNPLWVAVPGALFVLGRPAYWKAYVEQPTRRLLGNIVTVIAMGLCLLATVAGLVKSAL